MAMIFNCTTYKEQSTQLLKQKFTAICDKERKHFFSQEAGSNAGDSKAKKAVSQRHGQVYIMLGCAEAYRKRVNGENRAVNTKKPNDMQKAAKTEILVY